jgi:hypothetical protein
MPRYFFDFSGDGDRGFHDDEGSDLPSPEQAEQEAIAALLSIAKDEMAGGPIGQFTVAMRDGDGRPHLTATLLVRVERHSPPGE